MIPIARPLIGEDERAAVLAVLESGQLAQGRVTADFETQFAALCGTDHAIAVCNGTAALHLALLGHGIGLGDEVITTPFSFIATANSVLFTGARPVFADIDPRTYTIDPAHVEALITPRTRAIMPVHLYGQAADLAPLRELAERHGVVLLEDAAQAHAATYHGQMVGSFGTGCFSFYPTKNMTSGEGGMITTNDAGLAHRLRMLRQHGMNTQYYHELLGYNFRMTDLQAAVGVAQLGHLERWTAARIANAAAYSACLPPAIAPAVRAGCRHVFHQYTLRVPDREAALALLADAGVQARVYYPLPIHQQPLYRDMGFADRLPHAEQACREVLSIPVHPGLTDGERAQVCVALGQLAARFGDYDSAP